MKDGKKTSNTVGKRKVNKFTKVECESELARMQRKTADHNDTHKSGEQIHSKYYKDVQKQLLILG